MRRWIAACTLLVFIAPGCTKPAESGGGGQTETQLQPESSDEKIVKAVKDKFAADPVLKGEPIEVSVKDGRVSLSGTVSSSDVRAKADIAAREVDDVYGVNAEKLVTK